MKRNTLTIIITLIIVAGGMAWLWWNNQQKDTATNQAGIQQTQTTPTPSTDQSTGSGNPQAKEYSVIYSDTGFSPNSITIPAGSKVIFNNNSSREMWVGSDPHPDHTDHSEFDQHSEGETYAFTFSAPGTYTYHNHRNEDDKGTVIVQ